MNRVAEQKSNAFLEEPSNWILSRRALSGAERSRVLAQRSNRETNLRDSEVTNALIFRCNGISLTKIRMHITEFRKL